MTARGTSSPTTPRAASTSASPVTATASRATSSATTRCSASTSTGRRTSRRTTRSTRTTAPNGLQNFPVLTGVEGLTAGDLRIVGHLPSTANRSFAVEWFKSDACGPSGHGGGAEWIATTVVTTDGTGVAPVELIVPLVDVSGSFLTTTATDLVTLDTGEFSACLEVPDCLGATWQYGAGCPGSGGFVPELDAGGCAEVGQSLQLQITSALGGSTALVFVGASPARLPVGGGCSLLVFPVLGAPIAVPLGGGGLGNGSTTLIALVPPTLAGLQLTLQSFVVDPGNPIGAAATNGLGLSIP